MEPSCLLLLENSAVQLVGFPAWSDDKTLSPLPLEKAMAETSFFFKPSLNLEQKIWSAKEVVLFAQFLFWGFGFYNFQVLFFFAVKSSMEFGRCSCPSFGSWFYMITLSG